MQYVFISAAAEALKKWDGGREPRGRGLERGIATSPVMEVRVCHPRKMFENRGANLCNLVHFYDFRRRVQQKTYNSVFILDFGRSIWWHLVIKWHGKSMFFSAIDIITFHCFDIITFSATLCLLLLVNRHIFAFSPQPTFKYCYKPKNWRS